MNLKEALSQYCSENNLQDIQCVIHIALLNYVSNLTKSKSETINISPIILDSFIDIGIEKVKELFQFISKNTEYIDIYYEFKCKEKDGFSFSILDKDIEDKNYIEMNEGCSTCEEYHKYTLDEKDSYIVSYLGYREKISKELSLSDTSITNYMVLNTNEDNFEKLAKIIVSNLRVNKSEKKEVEKGLFKYMQSIKKFTGLVADISDDGSKITGNIKTMIEDVSGFSSIKEIIE